MASSLYSNVEKEEELVKKDNEKEITLSEGALNMFVQSDDKEAAELLKKAIEEQEAIESLKKVVQEQEETQKVVKEQEQEEIIKEETNDLKNQFIKTSKGNVNIKELLKNKEIIEETIRLNEELNKVKELNKQVKDIHKDHLSSKFDFEKEISETFKGEKIYISPKLQNDIFKYQIKNKDLADKLSHIKYINKELDILNENRDNIKLDDIVSFKNKFENSFLKVENQDKNGNIIKKYSNNNGLDYYSGINSEASKKEWEIDYKKLEEGLKNGHLDEETFDKVINKLKEREEEISNEYKDVNELNKFVSTNMETNKGKISSKNIFEISFKEYDSNTRTFKDKKINLLDDLESLNDKDSINKKLDHIMSSNMSFARQNKIDFISDYKKLLAEEAQARGKTFGDMNALDYISFYKLGLYAGDTFGSLKMLGTYLKENHQINAKREEIFSKLEEFKTEKNSVLIKEKEIIANSGINPIELEELKALEKKWLKLPGNEHKSIEKNSSEFNEFLEKEKVGIAFADEGLNLNPEDLKIIISSNTQIEEKRKELDKELDKLGIDSSNIIDFSKLIDANGKLDQNKFRNEINKNKTISLNYDEVENKIQQAIPFVEKFIEDKNNIEKNSYIGMISFFDDQKLDKEIDKIDENWKDKQLNYLDKVNQIISTENFKTNYKDKYEKGELTDLEKKIYLDFMLDIKQNVDLISKYNKEYNDNNTKKELEDLKKIYDNNGIEVLTNENFNKIPIEQRETLAKHLKIDLVGEEKQLPEGKEFKKLNFLNQDILYLNNENERNTKISKSLDVIKQELNKHYIFIKDYNENKKDKNENELVLKVNDLSSNFTDRTSSTVNSPEAIIDVVENLKKVNKIGQDSINGKNAQTINYDETKTNQTLSNGINNIKEKTSKDLEALNKQINEENQTLSDLERGKIFKDTVEKSFSEIGKQNESGNVLLGLFKNSVAGLKKEDLTAENIMKNWYNSGNVNFELGIKNILETFIFHKQEVKLMFDDMKREGHLPNYFNPEHFLGKNSLENESFKAYEKSFNDLQKYIKDNNIPEGVLKIDELNDNLDTLSKNNEFKSLDKEIELLRDKFLKSQYPNFDTMNSKEKEDLRNNNEAFVDVVGMNKTMKTKEAYKKELESALLIDPNFNSKSNILEDSLRFDEKSKNIINKIIENKILSKDEINRIEDRVKLEKEKESKEKEFKLKEMERLEKEREEKEKENNSMSMN